MFDDYPDVLNFREFCQILKIGRSKAYELLRNDVIKNKKIGRTYFILKEDVIKFLTN